jgi:hypothetical protein
MTNEGVLWVYFHGNWKRFHRLMTKDEDDQDVYTACGLHLFKADIRITLKDDEFGVNTTRRKCKRCLGA